MNETDDTTPADATPADITPIDVTPIDTTPATATVALIDADGVYRGINTIAADDLTDWHVQVPADCDLAPGKYRWVESQQRFDPLTELQQAPPGLPTLEAVVYHLVLLAQAQGATRSEFAAYVAEFKKSIDAIGAAT